jgi:hypothetical protein
MTMSRVVEPTENHGIEPEPCGVLGGHHGGEVILDGVGGDGHGEEGVPLGKTFDLKSRTTGMRDQMFWMAVACAQRWASGWGQRGRAPWGGRREATDG